MQAAGKLDWTAVGPEVSFIIKTEPMELAIEYDAPDRVDFCKEESTANQGTAEEMDYNSAASYSVKIEPCLKEEPPDYCSNVVGEDVNLQSSSMAEAACAAGTVHFTKGSDCGPKTSTEEKLPKRRAVRTTIELKKEIIAKYEDGARVSELAREFNMPRTTVSSIIKHKTAIKAADVAKGVKILCPRRSQTHEDMENLLLAWIINKQMTGESISRLLICEKAKQLYDVLQQKNPETGGDFMASRNWFDRFIIRTGVVKLGLKQL